MLARFFPVLGVMIAATAAPVVAQESPPAERPRIGLALSGGGARGAAHAGVLKVLEELHVPVDAISGTSVGAVVGGLYAAGVPAARIEEVLRKIDWNDALEDRPAYRDLVWRRKEEAARYLLDFEVGLHEGRFRLPPGFRAGQKLAFVLRALLIDAASDEFSELTMPLKIAATDVETGELVVLDHGDLADAILASISIPGVFAPVEIDGRLLVDGGVADNLPVDLARAAGADVVIAVDVGMPLDDRRRLDSLFSVLNQTTTFLTRKNTAASLADADLVVAPDLGTIGSSSFERADEALALGEAAARAAASELRRYALDDASWAAYVAMRDRASRPPFSHIVSEVRVEGAEQVDARVILGRVLMRTGAPIDVATLRDDLARVYGLDEFQRVTVDVERGEYGDAVVLRVKEKSWGPTYIKFGLEAADDLEGSATYDVRTSIARTRLNARGGEWRTELQIGSTPSALAEFFQPLDFRGHWFVAPRIEAQRFKPQVFDAGRPVARYDVRKSGGGIDFGVQFGRFGAMRLGLARAKITAHVDTGAPDLPPYDVDSGGVAFQLGISTLDRPAIPTGGGVLTVTGYFPRRALGSDDAYDRVLAGASRFFGNGRHTGFVAFSLGTSLGSTLPFYDEFELGGLFSLGGFSEGEFRGQRLMVASTGYYYRLATLPAGFGRGIYVGAIADVGNVWASSSDVSLGNSRHGFTPAVGLDTVLGPVFVAYGLGEGGSDRFYVTVGRSF